MPNACREWQLPARQLEGLWDSLVFSESLSRRALQYAELAIRLGDAGVNTNLVSAGKMLIFHGPPGTGTVLVLSWTELHQSHRQNSSGPISLSSILSRVPFYFYFFF